MEQNLKNNKNEKHEEFSASIYHSFPGQDRFGFPEYLARVTSGFGGETFLIFGSEKTALYDCGMAYAANGTIDNIHRELRSHGKSKLDFILLSHTHYDHIFCRNGLMQLFMLLRKQNQFLKARVLEEL